MANSVPLTFRAAPFPEGYKADPEQFKNDIVARLYAESAEAISFFASGTVAPSSNVGPWLKNGTEWYVWSDDLATYVPITVTQASLKWIAQFGAPDQTIYTFWIELDGTGKAIDIKYYSGGAWKDIYEDKFAAITTAYTAAIAAGDAATLASANAYTDAAVAGIPGTVAGQGVFRAVTSAPQDIVFGGAGNMTGGVDLGTATFDPDSVFSANAFHAPANGYYSFQGDLSTNITAGSPTSVDLAISFAVNGTPVDLFNNGTPDAAGGQTVAGATTFSLTAGDTVTLTYSITVDAACTVEINPARLSGFRIR